MIGLNPAEPTFRKVATSAFYIPCSLLDILACNFSKFVDNGNRSPDTEV